MFLYQRRGDLRKMSEKYGCFRCGEQGVEYEEVDFKRTCGSCGESDCVISFQESLDLVNEIYLQGYKLKTNPEEYEIDNKE